MIVNVTILVMIKPKQTLALLLCIAVMCSTGCGYASSGTWDDDDRIWVWAFDELQPPDGITVNHSRYWSSAHFTSEYIWHFDLTLDKAAIDRIKNDTDFQLIDADSVSLHTHHDGPGWFLPNGPSGFDVYRSSSNPAFTIYINPSAMRSYWTSSQL